jgi:hypothetical protein
MRSTMDKRAFDRAREQFSKKSEDLSEDALAERVKAIVAEVRSSPPPKRVILGATFDTSSKAKSSKASSTLTY